jgi:hypothetical protein
MPEAQSRLISMSARGRLPTSNTFELIRKWKLVKEAEEKQQQKVKVRWTVPTLLPRLSLAGLENPMRGPVSLSSQTNRCSTWKSRHKLVRFPLINNHLNNILGSHKPPYLQLLFGTSHSEFKQVRPHALTR